MNKKISIFILTILTATAIFTNNQQTINARQACTSYPFVGDVCNEVDKWVKNSDGSWNLYEIHTNIKLCDWKKARENSNNTGRIMWFYLDPKNDCKMKTGILFLDDEIYYLSDNGAMHEGWLNYQNNRYYFDTSTGRATKGWKQISKKWYYLDPTTKVMKTGLITVDNDTYYLDTSGAMLTDWHQINNNYYYFDGSNGGRAKTGWQQGASGWYYLDPTTKIMVTNKTLIINGTAYTFDSNGKWIS